MTLIEATGLTKRYGDTVALDGLDLRAADGQLLAVLGRNGAGKTTFVNLLATLRRPDHGSLRVRGVDVVAKPAEVRRLIGLAGQQATVEPLLTGRENLEIVAALFGLGRRRARDAANDLLADLELAVLADRVLVHDASLPSATAAVARRAWLMARRNKPVVVIGIVQAWRSC